MPLKRSVFEASKLVSTKTLLLKHYYRRQGTILGSAKWERLKGRNGSLSKIFAEFCNVGP